MGTQKHIIKKQILNLEIEEEEEAAALQDEFAKLYREKILPVLNNFFDELSDSNETVRLHTLEVDLGPLDPDKMEDLIASKLEYQLQQNVKEKVVPGFSPEQSEPEEVQKNSPIELFTYYMQTGVLPWWAESSGKKIVNQTVEELLVESPGPLKVIIKDQINKERSLRRLIYTFPDKTLLKMLQLMVPKLTPVAEAYNEDLETLMDEMDILKELSKGRKRMERWKALFGSSQPNKAGAFQREGAIEEVLWRIADARQINRRRFIASGKKALTKLRENGMRFQSELPQQLDAIHKELGVRGLRVSNIHEKELIERLLKELKQFQQQLSSEKLTETTMQEVLESLEKLYDEILGIEKEQLANEARVQAEAQAKAEAESSGKVTLEKISDQKKKQALEEFEKQFAMQRPPTSGKKKEAPKKQTGRSPEEKELLNQLREALEQWNQSPEGQPAETVAERELLVRTIIGAMEMTYKSNSSSAQLFASLKAILRTYSGQKDLFPDIESKIEQLVERIELHEATAFVKGRSTQAQRTEAKEETTPAIPGKTTTESSKEAAPEASKKQAVTDTKKQSSLQMEKVFINRLKEQLGNLLKTAKQDHYENIKKELNQWVKVLEDEGKKDAAHRKTIEKVVKEIRKLYESTDSGKKIFVSMKGMLDQYAKKEDLHPEIEHRLAKLLKTIEYTEEKSLKELLTKWVRTFESETKEVILRKRALPNDQKALEQTTRMLLKSVKDVKQKVEEVSKEEAKVLQKAKDPFNDADDVAVHNAGLVLLWPFLSRFFENTGLIEEGQFVSEEAREKAVLLLSYISDESTEIEEHELPLNKVMCGINIMEPLPTGIKITEKQQEESEVLVESAIANWPMLGELSIEGFRRAYIQREGILKSQEGNWLLQVERQTYDVIVDRVPWSIHVIKFPWLNQVIFVEW